MDHAQVEAFFQIDIKRAQEAFEDAVKRAESLKQKRMDALREADRAAYRNEQEFFFQG